jgi:hypothetical protein
MRDSLRRKIHSVGGVGISRVIFPKEIYFQGKSST